MSCPNTRSVLIKAIRCTVLSRASTDFGVGNQKSDQYHRSKLPKRHPSLNAAYFYAQFCTVWVFDLTTMGVSERWKPLNFKVWHTYYRVTSQWRGRLLVLTSCPEILLALSQPRDRLCRHILPFIPIVPCKDDQHSRCKVYLSKYYTYTLYCIQFM